jgi:hypothetical protein
MKSVTPFILLLLVTVTTQAQNQPENQTTATHWTWVCLERTIPGYTIPQHRLNFVSPDPCRVVVPVADGETLQIASSGIRAADRVVEVLASVNSIMTVEQNKRLPELVVPQIPHNEFGAALIETFNHNKEGARARFCAIYPLAYAPLLDWQGATEPKPCSDKAPRL